MQWSQVLAKAASLETSYKDCHEAANFSCVLTASTGSGSATELKKGPSQIKSAVKMQCVCFLSGYSPMNNLTFPFHSFFDNHPCAQSHEACVKEGPWSARPHPAASAAHVVELLVGVVVLQLLCRDQRGRELVFSVWEVQLIYEFAPGFARWGGHSIEMPTLVVYILCVGLCGVNMACSVKLRHIQFVTAALPSVCHHTYM